MSSRSEVTMGHHGSETDVENSVIAQSMVVVKRY